MAKRSGKFVLPAEGGSVVVERIKEILVGEENEIQRPTIGSPATSYIATVCTMLLWVAAAIVCLAIGIRHEDECDNLESNIPVYLIVQGVLSLVYAVTCGFGCCFVANFRKIRSWIVLVIAIINAVLSIVLIVWMIVGSVWLWNNWEDWDDNRKLCANEIYITAMASLIVSYAFWLFTCSFAGIQVFWSFFDKDDTLF